MMIDRKAAAERLENEAARLAAILARATPVEGSGPAIPIAPARGPQRSFTPHVVMPDEKAKGGYKVEATGWRGFNAVKAMDIFDDLQRRAEARKDKDGNPGTSPFTKGQVNIARRYRDLVERHDAGGMKCASLETRGSCGATSGGEFIDAFVAEGREIQRLQRLIGTGAAMVVRRVRPSARGEKGARIITDRALVDAICLHGKSFRQVLKAHGWTGSSRNIDMLIAALAASLDRMQGFRDPRKNSSLTA